MKKYIAFYLFFIYFSNILFSQSAQVSKSAENVLELDIYKIFLTLPDSIFTKLSYSGFQSGDTFPLSERKNIGTNYRDSIINSNNNNINHPIFFNINWNDTTHFLEIEKEFTQIKIKYWVFSKKELLIGIESRSSDNVMSFQDIDFYLYDGNSYKKVDILPEFTFSLFFDEKYLLKNGIDKDKLAPYIIAYFSDKDDRINAYFQEEILDEELMGNDDPYTKLDVKYLTHKELTLTLIDGKFTILDKK